MRIFGILSHEYPRCPSQLFYAIVDVLLWLVSPIVWTEKFRAVDVSAKGAASRAAIRTEEIAVIPPRSHDGEVHFDAAGREEFRKKLGLQNKFVVMYSGNHSPVHPLDTLMQAADILQAETAVAFCFIVSVLLTPASRNAAGDGRVAACDKRRALAGDATHRHKGRKYWRPTTAAV